MADAVVVAEERPGRSILGGIGLSSVVAAGLATLLNVLAGRELGVNGYADFLVVWGLFFTFTGVLPGLQQEVTRSVATARAQGLRGHRPVVGTLLIGVCGALVIGATSPVWAHLVLDDQAVAVSWVLAIGFLVYAWANHVNGTLAATRRWKVYATAILLDGVLRFVLVGAVLLSGTGQVGWALALVGAAFTWAILGTRSDVRAATVASGDASTRLFARRSAHAMLAAGCSALIVAGFPVLLELFASGAQGGADAGVVLAVLMATRAPLLLFLNGYQGVLITRLVDSPSPMRLMVRWGRTGVLVSVLAAAVAYVLGPPVLRAVFGPGYDAGGGIFVGLVAAGLTLAMITLTGWTALALRRHTLFVCGWMVAVAATSVLLTVPASLDLRVCVALTGGPVVGAVVHLTTLYRAAPRAPDGRVGTPTD